MGNTASTDQKKHPIEWVVFFLGLILTLSVIGYLSWFSIKNVQSPPEITVSFKKDHIAASPGRLHITVNNIGYQTAENVVVEAGVSKGGKERISGQLIFTFLPKLSSREGWIMLKDVTDNEDRISVRVVSYKLP
ncbi:MAG: hypothetical protein M3Q97_01880 [Bacteroidota bacterium]|nr:hypothetical protein [Bacteroidota bacterium]